MTLQTLIKLTFIIELYNFCNTNQNDHCTYKSVQTKLHKKCERFLRYFTFYLDTFQHKI